MTEPKLFTEDGTLLEHKHPIITERGTVLTEELIEALAREAEAGYDLETFQRMAPPKIGGGSGKADDPAAGSSP